MFWSFLFDHPQGATCRALCRYYNVFHWFTFIEYLLGMWPYVYIIYLCVCLVLLSVEDLFVNCYSSQTDSNWKPQRAKPDKSIKCDHKVHIIGDSHHKGSVNNVNHYLNTNFVVSSFIKPGANIKQIMHSQEAELQCLGKKDIIVVNGESNDLDNNAEKKKQYPISYASICPEIYEHEYNNAEHPS